MNYGMMSNMATRDDRKGFHRKGSEIWEAADACCGYPVDEFVNREGHDDEYANFAYEIQRSLNLHGEMLMDRLSAETGREISEAERRTAMAAFWADTLLGILDSVQVAHLEPLAKLNPDAAADMRRAIFRGMPFDGADDRAKEEGSLESTNDID